MLSTLYVHIKFYSVKVKHSKLVELLKSLPTMKTNDGNMKNRIRRNRVSIKDCHSKNPANIASLQVLGSGAKGCPKAIYFFTDQISYLFNCGEGTQRLAHEHRKKLAKIEHIFITNPIWDNIGGLLGLALTLQEMGSPKLIVHGPPKLASIFNCAKRLFFFNNLEVEVNSEMEFKDNVIDVKVVKIPETDCHSYICKLNDKPKTLCLEKCLEAGVPAGPLLGVLKNGQDVTLKNGKTVKACDVLVSGEISPTILLVDCAHQSLVDRFVELPVFEQYHKIAATSASTSAFDFTSNEIDHQTDVYAVVHFSPKEVVENQRYQKWIESFPATTYHLMLNTMNECPGNLASFKIQYKLNLINEKLFPLLKSSGFLLNKTTRKRKLDFEEPIQNGDQKSWNGFSSDSGSGSGSGSSSSISNSSSCDGENVSDSSMSENFLIKARTLDTIHLRPRSGLDTSNQLILSPDAYIDEAYAIENFSAVLNDYKKKYAVALKLSTSDDESSLNDSSETSSARVLFTGTGSSIPNKTRNTSGILWFNSDDNLILIDCAEGTAGQLTRFFGCDKINSIFIRIKAVFISHMHADHYLGIIAILLERKNAFNELNLTFDKISIFGPDSLLYWLKLYSNNFEYLDDLYQFYCNSDFIHENHKMKKQDEQAVLDSLSLRSVDTALVKHCANAFGVSFVNRDGFKLTYSGDTMPCDQLVRIGKKCDLLIHEATMEDELKNEALLKYHSTISEAVEQGCKMHAKQVILTHFSQRYAKVPRLNSNLNNNVAIAFDNMMADMSELKRMPLMYQVLHTLFFEFQEELNLRASKRQKKSEIVNKLI